ncbi:MAG: hypothetical protein D6772_15675 [Bacteroidetes bacterium]|nr:MAG: hypothetical protein D6772_15675 [Bacteroidota bacterium]
MAKRTTTSEVDLIKELGPETDLELRLLQQAEVQQGMLWGVPRYGHPEGEVFRHVKEVLDNIDALPDLDTSDRRKLRLIAFIHDTFKYKEDKSVPRNWNYHHAVLARRYLAQFVDDEQLLNLVQYHDEIYYIWRDQVIFKEEERAAKRMAHLLKRIDGANQLYYLFFKCDSCTGDKNPAPVQWVEENFPGIEPVYLPGDSPLR